MEVFVCLFVCFFFFSRFLLIDFGEKGSKKRSPRSPESQRKSFGTWSAKVAAAKKKSLERKKGADTLSMMRAEDGSELAESVTSMDKSLFGIWNRDGTAASSNCLVLCFVFFNCYVRCGCFSWRNSCELACAYSKDI
jgi:hypothetical protein